VNEADRQDTIDRYEARLREHGYSPETLGWGKQGRQEVRFGALAEMAVARPASSVLDVGCGFADLYDYLTVRGWRGQYVGIDIVPGLLEVARERHPDLDLRLADITGPVEALGELDFVIASGTFNAALRTGDTYEHIRGALAAMVDHTKQAVCVDFLSSHVEFEKPGAWHTDPAWAMQAARALSPRVVIRHDYMPYEFALFVFKDAAVSPRNVFRAFERQVQHGDER